MRYCDKQELWARQPPARQSRLAVLAGLAVCALLLCCAPLAAETVYVIDKLLVGLHEQQGLDSAILKVLPTGTELEVLRRDGELAFVREPEGATGWVDAGYLMTDQPARALLEILDQQNKDLADALREAESKIQSQPAPADGGLNELQERYEMLRRELASEKLKAGELQATLAELKGKSALRAETAARPKPVAEAATTPRQEQPKPPLLSSRNLIILILITSVVGFAVGAYCMDVVSRRRHGGFRV